MKQRPTTAKPVINARDMKELRELDSAQYQLIGSNLSHFVILNELGKGSYGVVYKVRSTLDNNVYVLKKINLTHLKPKHQAEALKEAQLLRKLKHPNIITYYMSFIEQENLCIVMEYAEGGDLQKLLKEYKERRKYLQEEQIWEIAKEISSAIAHLHASNIIHRDIKALNVFLTKERKVKLGDLGVSKIFNSETAMQGTRVGTPLYLAPELVQHQPYDFKVDVWALGCVVFYMAALEPPFQGENLIALGYSIVNRAPKALPQQYSQRLNQFIWKLLEKMPCLRPSIQEVNQIYFHKIHQKEKQQKEIFSPGRQQFEQHQHQRPQTSYVRMQSQDTEKLKKTRKAVQNELVENEENKSDTVCQGGGQEFTQKQNEVEDKQLQKIQQYQQLIKEQQEKIEKDRIERERQEKEREKIEREKERIEKEKQLERERIEREKERLDQERIEQERIETQRRNKEQDKQSNAHRILKIQSNEVELFIQDVDDRKSSLYSDNKPKLEFKQQKPNQALKGSVQIRPLSAQARGSSYANLACKPKILPININQSVKEVKKFTIFDLKGTEEQKIENKIEQIIPQQPPQQQVQQQIFSRYTDRNEEAYPSIHSQQKPKEPYNNARIKSAFILQYSSQKKKQQSSNLIQNQIVKHYTLKDLID